MLGLVFFNVAVVIRVVGSAWESLDPRPAQAAATLGASPATVFRTITLPALRPAVVSAATVVFLFCATAFGIVLTLGGARYATVETEIWLLTTTLFDLQAAAALSLLQLVVVAVLLLAARRARTVAPTARRSVPPRRPGRADAVPLGATLLLLLFVALPVAALVAGSLRVDGRWSLANYAALTTTGDQQALLVPVDRRAAQLAAHRRRRDVDGARHRPAGGAGRHPALPVDDGAAGARACSTASSCCRWGSRR